MVVRLMHHTAHSKSEKYIFRELNVKNGLAHSTVNDILFDKQGFAWFATGDGLCRYDGYNFVTYKPNAKKPTESIAGNRVNFLTLDSKGNIWATCEVEDISVMDYEKQRFVGVSNALKSVVGQNDVNIIGIETAPDGTIWVLYKNKIIFFNPKNGKTERLDFVLKPKSSLRNVCFDPTGNAYVTSKESIFMVDIASKNLKVVLDADYWVKKYGFDFLTINESIINPVNKGQVLVFTNKGVFEFEPSLNIFRLSKCSPGEVAVNNGEFENNDVVWICTPYKGIYRYSFKTEKGEFCYENHQNVELLKIYVHKNRGIWVATRKNGVLYAPIVKADFNHILHRYEASSNLSSSFIWSFFENQQGHILAGTDNKTLDYILEGEVVNSCSLRIPIDGGIVGAIKKGLKNDLWIGLYSFGILVYDIKNEKKTNFNQSFLAHHHPNSKNKTGLEIWSMRDFLPDSARNRMWVAGIDAPLQYYDYALKRFVNPHIKNGKQLNFVWKLYMHASMPEVLWICTNEQGLAKYNISTGNIKFFGLIDNNQRIIKSAMCVYIDSKMNLWIGTGGNGLLQYDLQSEALINHFDESDGLSNNTVYSVHEDKKGLIWVHTNKAINRFDPNTKTFVNFNEYDGVLNYEFNPNAYLQAKNGIIFLGGTNGITYFHPDSIGLDTSEANAVITNFKIYNQSALPDKVNEGIVPLCKNISISDTVFLNYKHNYFSFEFSSLDFYAPNSSRYRYKLEGFDKSWIETESDRRVASYTNLPSGTYLFRLLAANKHGKWSHREKKIYVIIEPPFWKTWWFLLAVISFCALLVYGFMWVRELIILHQNRLWEKVIEEKTRLFEEQKVQLLAKAKSEGLWLSQMAEKNLPKDIKPEKQSSQDEKLLEMLTSIVLERIADTELDVEALSKEIGLSRTLLYTKLKAITNMSVAEFVLQIRLNKAAMMLKKSDMLVSDIAVSVGFNDAAYFGKCFKKRFGLSPSEYAHLQ